MILMNSGRMSCRYNAGACRLAQDGEVRGDVLIWDRPHVEEAQNPGREALLSARQQPGPDSWGRDSGLEPQVRIALPIAHNSAGLWDHHSARGEDGGGDGAYLEAGGREDRRTLDRPR
jgi:hypothetical protein